MLVDMAEGGPADAVGGLPEIYRDVRRLGDGAEGGALEARDAATGRRVVLKHVPALRMAAVRHAFAVLREVASPHLPAPRALVADTRGDGSHWLVTDHVEGEPIPAERTTPADALREAVAVGHALAAIHRAGTHHGDVSRGNVVVTRTGGVTLIDLGCLGALGSGTPGFLAPEVLRGGGGPAADRFSLGCLLTLRLLGEVPWRAPQDVLAVGHARHVHARLHALQRDAGVELDAPLAALLGRLLDPEPSRRPRRTDSVVARLATLSRAAELGVDLPSATTWWLPQRWPYRPGPGGPDPAHWAGRLSDADSAPRLLAIAGPPGVGRRRVVEEVIQQLQASGRRSAVVCEPAALGMLVGRQDAHWLEAWTAEAAQGHEGAPQVLGVVQAPPWPTLDDDAPPPAVAAATAALLADAAAAAQRTIIVPVDDLLAEALRDIAGASSPIAVASVRPWDRDTVDRALRDVLECDDTESWGQGLSAATGGWPGRFVRAVEACAASDLEDATAAGIARALERAPAEGDTLDDATARAVVEAAWRGDVSGTGVPEHLHDGKVPLAAAVAAARHRLGPTRLGPLAREVARSLRDAPLPLSLAVDADRAADVDAALRGEHALPMSRPGAPAVVAWLEAGGATRVGDAALAVACRGLLAQGEAARAGTLARRQPDGAASTLEAARASQRLGALDEALDACTRVAQGGDADLAAAATGLRWRLRVDQGRSEDALEEARTQLPRLHAVAGVGRATAHLWAAMAAMQCGETGTAVTWLDAAQRAAASKAPRGVASVAEAAVLARVAQLRGNLAHATGDLAAAHRGYAEAAEAFAAAAEPAGEHLARGSAAGLAIPTFSTARGIADARTALRGLVSRGQLAATLEAALNLGQLLVRTGAVGQAQGVLRLVDALFAHRRGRDAVVRGRLERLRAEVLRGRRGTPPAQLVSAFMAAATDLEAAQADREATEAWLCAAAVARTHGDPERARELLRRAAAVQAGDDDSQAGLALEGLALALADPDAPASEADRALQAASTLGTVDSLAARGRLDLAWALARATGLLVARRLPPPHRARRAAAARIATLLETIMERTAPDDRAAVRRSLTQDVDDREAFRDLLAELDAPPDAAATAPARGAGTIPPTATATATPSPSPSTRTDGGDVPVAAPTAAGATRSGEGTDGQGLDGLLRAYRRLAREDDLPRLLEQVVDAMMELTRAERGAVVVLPPTSEGTRLEVTRELAPESDGVTVSRSVIDRALTEGEPVLSVDAADDARFDGSRSISHLNLRSVLAVPLRFRGEMLGAAYVDHRLRRGAFDQSDLGRMEEFADLAALAVAHARAVTTLRAQARELEGQREQLASRLEAREAEVEGLRGRVTDDVANEAAARHGMVGNAPGMQRVFRLIDRLADSDVPVVIHGESGTGKELVARAIHQAGPRGSGPFVAENCGAIPETLLESVLFGHARGAFTGASRSKAGLFEAASGGTIFLDEVGEMSAGMQTKLLRVLQEGEVRRIGENRPRAVDVRVIAASNRDLEAMVASGEFRQDLYYRIHVVQILLPPLRERLEDLPALVQHMLRRHDAEHMKVGAASMRRLTRHAWPGNVRELDNEVQRWVALAEGEVTEDDLSPAIGTGAAPDAGPAEPEDLQIKPQVEALETRLIERALTQTGGNQTRAAALLGLSRYGLQKKLRRRAEAQAEAAKGEGA